MEQSAAAVTDSALVEALAEGTYEEVARTFDVSRGRVYSAACRLGARRNELRIRQRKQERRRLQLEFAQSVLNATAKTDVLDFMDGLPDEHANLILTSPPYNIGRDYGSGAGADSYQYLFYVGFLLQVISEMARVLKPGGVLFLQVGSTKDASGGLVPIDCILFQHLQSLGLSFQSRVAWVVPHGLTPKRRLSERYETALVFSKGAPATFNPDVARTPQRNPAKRAYKGPNKGKLSGHPYGAHPSNVWEIPNAGANRKDGVEGHPAQMPTELARRAVMLYTMPGDMVIDPFSGSGTTHAVCIRTGRAFCGADLFYEDLRAERLASVAPDAMSILPGITEQSLEVWNAEAVPVQHQPEDRQVALAF